ANDRPPLRRATFCPRSHQPFSFFSRRRAPSEVCTPASPLEVPAHAKKGADGSSHATTSVCRRDFHLFSGRSTPFWRKGGECFERWVSMERSEGRLFLQIALEIGGEFVLHGRLQVAQGLFALAVLCQHFSQNVIGRDCFGMGFAEHPAVAFETGLENQLRF